VPVIADIYRTRLAIQLYATLKSIDYNVAMTFILNNDNNNASYSTVSHHQSLGLAENLAGIYVVYTYTHNSERLTMCMMSTLGPTVKLLFKFTCYFGCSLMCVLLSPSEVVVVEVVVVVV